MIDFDFKRSSRKCAVSGRRFNVGEEFHSILVEENGQFVRKDVSAEDWNGPPENCIGWWKSKIPDLAEGQVFWAPKDVLLAFFQHLADSGKELDTTYVMAVLLVQKKHLRLLDTITRDDREFMLLTNNSTKEKFEVVVTPISNERIRLIQDELTEKLFTDIAPADE